MISRDESIQPTKQRQDLKTGEEAKPVDPGMTGGGHQGERPADQEIEIVAEVAVVEMTEDPAEAAREEASIDELRPHFAELDPVEVHHDAPQEGEVKPGTKAA